MRCLTTPESNTYCGTSTLQDCLDGIRTILGSSAVDGTWIEEFERTCAEVVDCAHAVTFGAGRMALYAVLKALEIGPGDEVILPGFTCVVVPNAILYCGARPIYADIDPRTFNIDVEDVERKITPRTRAILAQHTFGLPCDVRAIRTLAHDRGIDVIEDWAHALGAQSDPGLEGCLRRIAFFSTDHTKVITTSTGGAVATDDDELAARLLAIQQATPFPSRIRTAQMVATLVTEHFLTHPRLYPIGKYVQALGIYLGLLRFFRDEGRVVKPPGYPERLTNVQARIGVSQLSRLTENVQYRRAMAHAYDNVLGLYSSMLRFSTPTHVFLRYSFLVTDREAVERAFDGVVKLDVWFTSVTAGRTKHLHEIGYVQGTCPVAEWVAQHIVNLPTHFRVANLPGILNVLTRLRRDQAGGMFTLPNT